MNREIKFRAWSKIEKWIDNDFFISSFGKLYQDAKKRWDISDIAIESAYDDLIVMQWTGLKDKNGKEIYEGDIIMSTLGSFEIKYKKSAFYAKPLFIYDEDGKKHSEWLGSEKAMCNMSGIETCEIAGNIYENPELLR